MNDMEYMNTSTASLFRQAIVDPVAVSMADFDRLLSEYPYAQPLHFALARKKFLEGDPHPLSEKAVLLAPSPHWLREYVQGPDVTPSAPKEEQQPADLPDALASLSGDEEIEQEELPEAELTPSAPKEEQRPADLPDTIASSSGDEGIEQEELPEPELLPSSSKEEQEPADLPDAMASSSGDEGTFPAMPEEDELETLMRENIGGYSLDALYDEKGTEPGSETAENGEPQALPEEKTEGFFAEKEEKISLYDDELMPYTFRWWLHKTRMEHARTYRPFAHGALFPVASRFDPAKLDEIILDQQIREHIIHLQSPEEKLSEEVRKKEVLPVAPNKTSEAIERFIREEPQIQPAPTGQLTMENKARKSTEERFDQVTETLAAIYAEQGLLAKSIAVYKKLILKFPEKKSYFASRIQELEEKTQ